MLRYLIFEVRRTGRNLPFLFYTIVFPVGFYLLFSSLFGGSANSHNPITRHYMVSIALYGMMGVGITSVGAQIAFERRGGWTRFLSVTPLRPATYLVIKMGAGLLLSLPVIILVLLAGDLVNGVHLSPAQWGELVPWLLFASLPFLGIGIAVGYTFLDEAASGISVILLFFFAIAGGLWIPPELFPSWLASLSRGLPSYWGSELGRRIVDGQSFSATGLLIFVAWLVAAMTVAGWRFRKAS